MQKYQDVVLNQNGNPVSGVQVTVTDLLGTPVSVYSANAIGLNVNPLTSDNNGRFSFYAPDGRYNLSFSFGGNVVASITDILLEDPMDGSDAVFNDVTILGELSDASKVTSAPVGGLTATNVQAALAELDSEKIDASSLAATGGAALVGYGAGTVATALAGVGAVDEIIAGPGIAVDSSDPANPSVSWKAPTVVAEAGTSLLATAANAGRYTRFTAASAKTYTFNSTETYAVGDEYHARNVGAGNLTLTPAGSFVLNAPAGGSLVVPPGATVTMKIVAAAEADVIGYTEAP